MDNNNEVVYLYLDDIIPNRFQPREVFDDQALKELAVSIKEHGVIQPIIVRKVENKYEIIAGERRYKASTMAGLTKIPAIVKNLDDKESSKVALIENLQRRDLTPIEEARTYQKILSLEDGMTQEQLAQTMGKTQSVVSNKLRLLALPDEVQDALLQEKISERHARSLLNLNNKNDQIKMLDKVIAEKMTVRELDKEIKDMNDNQGQNSNMGNIGGNNFDVISAISNISSMNSNNSAGSFESSNLGKNDFNSLDNNSNATSFNSLNSNNSSNLFNPTTVDINKIRESAVDIGGAKESSVDIKDLMKDTTIKPKDDFRFVPSSVDNSTNINSSNGINDNTNIGFSSSNSLYGFGGNINSNSLGNSINSSTNFGDVSSSNSNSNMFVSNSNNSDNFSSNFSNFFNNSLNNSNNEGSSNNNISSSIGDMAFSLNSNSLSPKKDVSSAINDIKMTVKGIESKGYNVTVEENDSDNSYQIVIKVDKN